MNLKPFLISLILVFVPVAAMPCFSELPQRWYMFCVGHDDAPVSEKFEDENLRFWKQYTGSKNLWSCDPEELSQIALQKGDRATYRYLNTLKKFDEVVSSVRSDSWEYPTETQLRTRKATLNNVVATCRKNYATASNHNNLKQRWLLLEMRANMLLRNYSANIVLWDTKASKLPPSLFRDMMRNIYANALLNTGRKIEAWNIYVEQNDLESLQWSVRKYTNLAGIKKLCAESPNAPVLAYLLQRYINNIQDIYDGIEDSGERQSTIFEDYYEVYAHMSDDWKREINDFLTFATAQGDNARTQDPCMWLTAAALVSYYKGDYSKAGELIDKAMSRGGSSPCADMSRRVRMLIYCKTHDVHTPAFKDFIVGELKWLDRYIAQNPKSKCAVYARDRIYNLGLAQSYLDTDDADLAYALLALHDKTIRSEYLSRPDDDHSSEGFTRLFARPAADIENYFNMMRHPGGDALAVYLSERLQYSDDYANDIIGTKYLAHGEFAKAIPYLKAVSQDYLNKQAIAPYVARRDYHKPAWYGWQKLGDIPWKPVQVNLKGNVKLQFCEEVDSIRAQYMLAAPERRAALALKLGQYIYQASPLGQCWFISDYSNSQYDKGSKEHKLSRLANSYLNDALHTAKTQDVYAEALFGLVGTAPDTWCSENYDYDTQEMVRQFYPDAQQTRWLSKLSDYVSKKSGRVAPHISHCDVLKQFRRFTNYGHSNFAAYDIDSGWLLSLELNTER